MNKATLARHGIKYLSAKETGQWSVYIYRPNLNARGYTWTAGTLKMFLCRPDFVRDLENLLGVAAAAALAQHVARVTI